MTQPYSPDAIQSLLEKKPFGIDSLILYPAILADSEICGLLEEILLQTYGLFFGPQGADFVRVYFHDLHNLPAGCSLQQVTQVVLNQRDIFRHSPMHDQYYRVFRPANLQTSVQAAGATYFTGTVVDVGADDNLLGRVILELCPHVDRVIGTDIEDRSSAHLDDRLEFRVQSRPTCLPLEDGEASLVVSRYSFHHMITSEQTAIRDEIARALAPGGRLIVFENSWSFKVHPLPGSTPLHSRILTLQHPTRVRLLLAGLDIFSHGIKSKQIPFPSTYHQLEDWLTFFADGGLVPVQTLYYGLPLFDLHQSPLAIFILEKGPRRNPTRLV